MKNQHNNRTLHISLWIMQAAVAALFFLAGFMKAAQPIDALAQALPWTVDVPEIMVRLIGVSELLGALGLLLPSLLRIKPAVTPLAAAGLTMAQLSAVAFHLSRGETATIGFNLFLIAAAAFIAWGRFTKAAIQPKS